MSIPLRLEITDDARAQIAAAAALTTSLACFVCNPPWAQGHAVPACQASAESRSFEFGTTCTIE